MKSIKVTSFFSLIFIILFSACQNSTSTNTAEASIIPSGEPKEKELKFIIETTKGDIKIKLYNETPLHRDNFVKLVEQNFYDSILFHRIINEFMIQTGDPDSKGAASEQMLGMGGPGWTVPSEISEKRIHTKGVLSAARQGDQANPYRASSGSQFFIVTGKTLDTTMINQFARSVHQQIQYNYMAKLMFDATADFGPETAQEAYQAAYQECVTKVQAEFESKEPFSYTPEQVEAYQTIGGSIHLDAQYTAFGEVIDGMDVVEAIEGLATGANDRPVEDVMIITVKQVKK